MLKFILVLEIFLCWFLSLAIYFILFNLAKIKATLSLVNEKVNNFRKQIPEIQIALNQFSVQYFLKELILNPASLFALLEIITLARQKALTRKAVLKVFFK